MILGAKLAVAGVTAVSVVSLLSSLAIIRPPQIFERSNDLLDVMNADENVVAGRIVTVPAKIYREAFKATLKLGQCPLVMEKSTIKTCSDEFTGDVIFLGKGSTNVDVSRVQSSEDILQHVMGGVGVSVGVLGLASVSAKVNVAVTTETSRKTINLISSYEVTKGMITLHNPRPKKVSGDKALFLSEIELGGSEMLLVTLEFESEKKKVEVQISVTFKILFISITAKVKYVHNTLKMKAKARIQFKSTWREGLDEYYDNLGMAIPRIEEVEKMYAKGPEELREMSVDNELSHNMYYFSSWKQSPYEGRLSMALVNHELEFLTEQNTEVQALLNRINKLKDRSWDSNTRQALISLNMTVADIHDKLTVGLKDYHKLTTDARQKLRTAYGENKAPQYYQRKLNSIIA